MDQKNSEVVGEGREEPNTATTETVAREARDLGSGQVDADRAFPPHVFYYHGLMTECDVCGHPAKCVRLVAPIGAEMSDVCPACVEEGNAPPDLVVGMWCTECSHTIPMGLRSDNLTL